MQRLFLFDDRATELRHIMIPFWKSARLGMLARI